jgi:Tfp pilus assembly protein PilF
MRFTAVVCLVAVVMVTTPVRAQSGREQTKQHFRAGLKHYNLGEFDEALREFKEAYRQGDDPAMLYNIGQCQRKLGDLRSALHSYRSYLRMGKDVANRAEVEGRIQDIEAQLKAEEEGTKATAAASAAAGAEGQVQGLPARPLLPRVVPPATGNQAGGGENATVTTATGAPAKAAMVTLAPPAAATASTNTAMVPPTPPVPATAPIKPAVVSFTPPVAATAPGGEKRPAASLASNPNPPPVSESTPFYKSWWFWTGSGAVVAGAVVTAVLLNGSSAGKPACPAGVRCP